MKKLLTAMLFTALAVAPAFAQAAPDTTKTATARAAVAELRKVIFILVVPEPNRLEHLLGERDDPSPAHNGR